MCNSKTFPISILQKESELKKNFGKYLIIDSNDIKINWKLMMDEQSSSKKTFISKGDLGDMVLNEALELNILTAQNSPKSHLITDGEEVFSPRDRDGEFYSFSNKDYAKDYVNAIGLTEQQIYSN